jgi:hypothetical protein
MPKRIQTAFTAGELSPQLHARVDLAKYRQGAARLKNWQILPFGGVVNRAGFEFVGEVGNGAALVRLVDFTLSGRDTCVLEFGEGYMSVIRGGAYVAATDGSRYTIPTQYTAAQMVSVVFQQTNDVLTLTHIDHPPRKLSRYALNDWRFEDYVTTPDVDSPNYLTGRVITRPLETAPDADGNPYPTEFYYPYDSAYTVTAVSAATGRESPPLAYRSVNNDLFLRGFANDIGFVKSPGAESFRVYKSVKGALYGLVGTVDAAQAPEADGLVYWRDTNFTPDTATGPAKGQTPFPGPGYYPRASTIFQQRTVFGGPSYKPNRIDMSQPSDLNNFDTTFPSKASDAIVLALASRQRQDVLFFVPTEDLLCFTISGEFRIKGDDSGTLSPTTIDARQQSAFGCSENIQPIAVLDDIIFVQSKGQMVRSIAYDFGTNKYRGIDMSLLSRHLFEGAYILQMAYASVPFSCIYFVLSNGRMLACSYLKDQEVLGWSEFITDGVFESVCVVADGREDVIYAVVRRTVGGLDKRFVERQRTRIVNNPAEAFFIDAGLSRTGDPIARVTGLGHLEGRLVSGVVDGLPVRDLPVVGGAVDLPFAGAVVSLGLPYQAVLTTLDIDVGAAELNGELRNPTKIIIHVDKTIGLRYGPGDDGTLYEHEPLEQFGELLVNGLYTGSFEARFEGDWNNYGRVSVTADLLPATVLAVSPEFETGGDTERPKFDDGKKRAAGRRGSSGGDDTGDGSAGDPGN